MAEQNVFDLLNDDEAPEVGSPKEKTEETNLQAVEQIVTSSIEDQAEADSQAWTDVSSTKTRKLAPQFTLSKTDFAPDKSRSSQPTPEAKKKVIRFTRDDLLTLRRVTKPLPFALENPDISSVVALDPECIRPIDHDEVLSIWNAGETRGREGGGRGRGRGRGGRGNDGDGHYSNNHHHHEDPLPDDIWDDVEVAGKANKGFDLAEFSAATVRFSEMGYQKDSGNGGVELYSLEGDEMMESLMQDQSSKGSAPKPAHKGGASNEKGRNLLMGALSVKPSTGGGSTGGSGIVTSEEPPSQSAAQAAEVARRAKVQSSTDDTLLDALIEDDATFGGGALGGGGGLSTDMDIGEDEVLDLDGSALCDDSLIMGEMSAPSSSILSGQAPQPQVQFSAPAPAPLRVQAPVVAPPVSPPKPPPQPQFVEGWLYQDPQRNVQGPFETSSMRRWLESGYFKEHLPIKMPHWGGFYPLGVVFPNPEVAFLGQTLEPVPAGPALVPPVVPVRPVEQVQAPTQQTAQPAQQQQQQPMEDAVKSKPTVQQADKAVVPKNKEKKATSVEGKKEKNAEVPEGGGSASPAREKSKEKKKKDKEKKDPNKEAVGAATATAQPAPDPWGVSGQKKSSDKQQLSLAEIQQQEEEAAKEGKTTGKSFQLKNLLGVGAGGGGGAAWTSGSGTQPSSSASLAEIQEQQEKVQQQQLSKKKKAQQQQQLQQQQDAAAGRKGTGPSQWKAAAPAAPEKSLAQIMEEEEKAAAAAAAASVQSQSKQSVGSAGGAPASSRPAPGSWAARAGGASGVPTSNWTTAADVPAAKPAAPVALTTPASVQTQKVKAKAPAAAAAPAAASKGSAMSVATGSGHASSSQPSPATRKKKEGSGSPRKSEMVEWSVSQVKALNGEKKSSTEDLALIEFCLTLTSAADIREYLAHYLGSTPQVSQFATEFIRRKEGKPPSSNASVSGGIGATTGASSASSGNGGFQTTTKKKKNKTKTAGDK